MKISKELSVIIISIFLFILSFIFKNIAFGILIVTYLLVSFEVFIKVIKNFGKGIIFDENFLMTIATIGALVIGEYHEAVAVMLFYQIGEYMNDLGIDKSKDSIKKLIDKRSDKVIVIKNGKEREIDPKKLLKKDIIVIRPGERIPVDGVVIEGVSNVDTSSITGESMLKEAKVSDIVYSGYVNMNGILKIEVTNRFEDSLVSKILKVIEESEIDKSNKEKFITKFSKIYTPIVVLGALLLFVIPTVFFNGKVHTWGYRSLVFLVASCPCALVLSIPLGYFCGIGRLSKRGILVKSSSDLEKASKIDIFAFDKTGTLTKGVFEIKEINPRNIRKNELLAIASYAEYYSNHPIAISIKKAYKKEIDPSQISNFKEGNGGISVTINKDKILVGNYDFLLKKKIKILEQDNEGTVVYVSKNNEYIGNIVIGDVIKDEAQNFIMDLKKMGVSEEVILSGDNEVAVKEVATSLGINKYYYSLQPLDKKKCINTLKENKKVCFVGD